MFMETISNTKIAENQKKYSIIRIALISILIGSLMASVVGTMKIPMPASLAFIISTVCVIGFSAILSRKRHRAYTIGITGAITIYIVLCWQGIIFSAKKYEYLYNYILYTIRYGIVNTSKFMTMSDIRFGEDLLKKDVLINAMPMIIIIISFILVATLRKRITLLPSIIIVAVLTTPSIVGGIIPSIPLFALMISAFIGIYTLDINYQSVNHIVESTNAKINKDKKVKRKKREKINSFSHRRIEMSYNRHSIAAIFCSVICMISFMLSAIIVPKDGYDIRQKAIDSYNTISATIRKIDFKFKSPWKNGNSGKNGIVATDPESITSNMLSITPSELGDTEILKVMTKKPEVIYLRGQVGAEYFDGRWTPYAYKFMEPGDHLSISQPDYPYNYIYEFFNNDIAYTEDRQVNDDIYRIEQVNIEYLEKSKYLYLPSYPLSYDDYIGYDGAVDFGGADTYEILFFELFDKKSTNNVLLINIYNNRFWEAYHSELDNYRELQKEAMSIHEQDDGSDGVPVELLKGSSFFDYYEEIPEDNLFNHAYIASLKVQLLVDEHEERAYNEAYYSYIPPEIEEDITRLSNELTSPDQNQYEKTMAIYYYLKDNFLYSIEPQVSSKGYDDVRAFLFETKRGHCALSATSMAMLLRAQGYPTRYCTGFVANTIGSEGVATAIVKESGLHAWTEVYFEGIGWIPFDATASTRFNINMETESQTTTTTASTSNSTTSNSGNSATTTTTKKDVDAMEIPKELNVFFVVSIIIVSIAALIFILIWAGDRKQKSKFAHFKNDTPTKAAHKAYRYVLKLLKESKLIPMAGELPQEFAIRVDNEINLENVDVNFAMIMPIFEGREFGLNEVSDSERKKILKYTTALYDVLVDSKPIWRKIYLKIKL